MQQAKTIEFKGFTWELLLPSNIDTELAENRCWDREVKQWMDQHIKPGMIVLDVGANFGWFTLIMSGLVGPEGRVYAFEPEPTFRKRLERHLYLNEIHNVIARHEALWDTNAMKSILKEGPPYHSSAIIKDPEHVGNHDTVACCMRLDDLGIEAKIDFIKIDVDGCENKVLRGAQETIRRDRPIIAIEIMIDYRGRQAMNFLLNRGYKFRNHKNHVVTTSEIMKIKGAGTVNLLALP